MLKGTAHEVPTNDEAGRGGDMDESASEENAATGDAAAATSQARSGCSTIILIRIICVEGSPLLSQKEGGDPDPMRLSTPQPPVKT